MSQTYHCRNCNAHFPEDRVEFPHEAHNPNCPICGMTILPSSITLKNDVTLQQLLDMRTDAEIRIMEVINREIRDIQYTAGVPVDKGCKLDCQRVTVENNLVLMQIELFAELHIVLGCHPSGGVPGQAHVVHP